MYKIQDLIDKRQELWKNHKDLKKDKAFIESVIGYMTETKEKHEHYNEQLKDNPDYVIELFDYVVDKNKNQMPFIINASQWMLSDHLEDNYRPDRKNKTQIVKGRQAGLTTYITARQSAIARFNKNFWGLTTAQTAKDTSALFEEKAKYPISLVNDDVVPEISKSNSRELYFKDINSRWECVTAEGKDVGRSKTLTFYHASEPAFYNDLKGLLGGIDSAMVLGSQMILESTANGLNYYEELWNDKNSDMSKLFIPWWITPEYSLKPDDTAILSDFKTAIDGNYHPDSLEWALQRCKWLLEVGRTEEQVCWYYIQWKALKGLIRQEFPCTAEEAFLSSGECVFNKDKINQRIVQLNKENNYVTGRFEFEFNDPETRDYIIDETIIFRECPEGELRLYEEAGNSYYVVGGDTAGDGSDSFTGKVINNVTKQRCLTLEYPGENNMFYAHQMYCIGKYYSGVDNREALMSIEINFNTAPLIELKRLGYKNFFKREKYDEKGKIKTPKIGWKTDGTTRTMMIEEHKETINEHIERLKDIPTLKEHLTFERDKNGRPDAKSGKHDDLLFSDMIAEQACKQQKDYVPIKLKVPVGMAQDLIDDLEYEHRMEERQTRNTRKLYNVVKL